MSAKTTHRTGHRGARYLVNIILRAIPVARGVATVTTALLGELDVKSGFSMLGIGLLCIGIYLLKN